MTEHIAIFPTARVQFTFSHGLYTERTYQNATNPISFQGESIPGGKLERANVTLTLTQVKNRSASPCRHNRYKETLITRAAPLVRIGTQGKVCPINRRASRHQGMGLNTGRTGRCTSHLLATVILKRAED